MRTIILTILILTALNVAPLKNWGQERINSALLTGSFEDHKIDSLLNRASTLRRTNPDSAFYYAYHALHLCYLQGDHNYKTKVLLTLGSIQYDLGRYRQAEKSFKEGLHTLKQFHKGQSNMAAKYYTNLGNVFSALGENDSAIFYHLESIALLEQDSNLDQKQLLNVHSNLSAAFFNAGQFPKGLQYLRQSITVANRLQDSSSLSTMYNNLGLYWLRMSQKTAKESEINQALDSARFYWNLVIDGWGDNTSAPKLQSLYTHLSLTYIISKQFDQAKQYLDAALRTAPRTALQNPALQRTWGDYYYQTNQYSRAIPYYERCLLLLRSSGGDKNYSGLSIIEFLALCYHKTGQGSRAYALQKEYSDLYAEAFNAEKTNAISGMEIKYHMAQKENELMAQKLQLSLHQGQLFKRNLWIGGVATAGMLLLLLLANYYRNKQRLQSSNLQALQQQQEIERLNSRMLGEELERERIARELHDGVSVLLTAAGMGQSMLAKEYEILKDADTYNEVVGLISQAGEEVSNIAHNLMPEILVHKSLPAAIGAFCTLMENGSNIKFKLQVFGTLPPLSKEFSFSAYRIVQEIIQNIIRHAQATEVKLMFVLQKNGLNLTIEDNGIGFDPEHTSLGMGLRNLSKRVEELKGEISFDSRIGEGTSVEVSFELL